MIRKPWLFVLTGVAFVLASAALAGAHENKMGKAAGDTMKGCAEHHSAVMKASDEVSMHLAEAKRSTALAEMRTHVEMAEKAMAAMKDHMSTCMEGMGKMHGGSMTGGTMSGRSSSPTSAAKVIDPVCGMEVDPATSPKATHAGKTYSFCSEDEKAKFEKNPEAYVGKKG